MQVEAAHPADTGTGSLHTEGDTLPDGTLVFGLTSEDAGDAQIEAWLDRDDDDLRGDGEKTDTAVLHWVEPAGCTLVGDEGPDLLRGTPGADAICGLEGNDTIKGRGGADVVFGGSGADRIFGGAGRDTVRVLAGRGDEHDGALQRRLAPPSGSVGRISLRVSSARSMARILDPDLSPR